MTRRFVVTGAIAAALAVIFGAFGAHALKSRLGAESMAIYQTAVQYHFIHALGLIAVGIVGVRSAGWCFLAGLFLFSGSLYTLALTDVKWLGAITPLGGVAFIVGWILLAVAASRSSSSGGGPAAS